jgi:hypothetical protein
MYYNRPPLDQWASDTLDNAVQKPPYVVYFLKMRDRMKTCRAEPKINVLQISGTDLNCRRGWFSSIVIMASSTTDESHRSRFLLVCFSCLFINGSALSLSLFSLWVCVRRGAALVFPWSLLQPYMAEQDAMLIACYLDLNWAGLESGDAERSLVSFCGYESFILLHTKLWTIERSEGRRGFVCLFVCLFVCCVCKPSG